MARFEKQIQSGQRFEAIYDGNRFQGEVLFETTKPNDAEPKMFPRMPIQQDVLYLGSTWRVTTSGVDLVFEKLSGGVWTVKQTISAV